MCGALYVFIEQGGEHSLECFCIYHAYILHLCSVGHHPQLTGSVRMVVPSFPGRSHLLSLIVYRIQRGKAWVRFGHM